MMALENQKKLFRNCPKEIEFNSEYEGTCRNCPRYETCLLLKKERNAKRRKAKKQMFKRQKALRERRIKLFLSLGVGVLLLLLSLIGVICFLISLNEDSKVYVANTETIDINESEEESEYVREGQNSTERYTAPIVMADEMPEKTKEICEVKEEPINVLVPEISAYGPSEDYYYYISCEDKIIMAKVLYRECRGECFKGKVAVAAVILNRFYSGLSEFDTESIYAVVTQGSQFADISEVTMDDLDSVPECMEAVEAACKGWDPTREMFPEGARHFYAPKGDIAPYQLAIREGINELVIGNHNFHNDFNMENVEERVERIIAEQSSK